METVASSKSASVGNLPGMVCWVELLSVARCCEPGPIEGGWMAELLQTCIVTAQPPPRVWMFRKCWDLEPDGGKQMFLAAKTARNAGEAWLRQALNFHGQTFFMNTTRLSHNLSKTCECRSSLV